TTTERRTTTTDARPATVALGRIADGNRLLMIGDSILASTAERYTNEMCYSLVSLGWAVEIDAETGQTVEFGSEVLDARLRSGWDAAVVFLGNNYTSEPQLFAGEMRRIVERLTPRPIVLVTVSEYDRRQVEVNYILRSLASEYEDVRIVDWAAYTGANDDLTVGDGLHPTDEGRQVLVSLISSALGRAPRDTDWRASCLPTQFTDDTN
ncbi:MAG: SGNH/GDSL hydrolase family protein, partial [Ilumatobacteraceae bacterium]